MAILTLPEYKALAGVDVTDTRNDDRITALLPAVENAISIFCDRKFVVAAGLATARTFEFEGKGVVDIDDCIAITGVTTDAGVLGATYALDLTQWTAQPGDSSPTYYYLRIHSGPFHSFSPEMGFERNLDQYEGYTVKPVSIHVTANWGWPSIPPDVKLAAAWMIQDIVDKPGGDNLSAEAIEGFSRSWAGTFSSIGIPNRARDILISYQRVY